MTFHLFKFKLLVRKQKRGLVSLGLSMAYISLAAVPINVNNCCIPKEIDSICILVMHR